MKQIFIKCFLGFSLPMFLGFAFTSCESKNEFIEIISTDQTKPDQIKNYRVVNFNGGAYIIYDIPNANNILYVQAEYYIDGKEKYYQTRSSYFVDTIAVEGFQEAAEYDVKLTAVSRANISSDPITVKVNPLIPVYKKVAQTLDMTPDFAGVRVTAKNEDEKNIGIVFLDDILGNYNIRGQNFTAFSKVSYAVRGYDTLPKKFAAFVTDKWGNRSDTVYRTVKPLYEKELDKSRFEIYSLPDNETPTHSSFPGRRIFDNSIGSSGSGFWHTGNVTTLPLWVTFSLGTYVKLSRFKFYPRQKFTEYGHNHPKHFSLWGSDKDKPGAFEPPQFAEEGTQIGDWVNLGNFEYPEPPSGAARTSATQADKDFFNAGVEYPVSFDAPKTKYIRLVVSETFSGGTIAQGAEIFLWGDDRQ